MFLFLKDSNDYGKFESTALMITDREQKLLAEMDRLNLLDNSKLTVSTLKISTYLLMIINYIFVQFITKVILKYKLSLEILDIYTF